VTQSFLGHTLTVLGRAGKTADTAPNPISPLEPDLPKTSEDVRILNPKTEDRNMIVVQNVTLLRGLPSGNRLQDRTTRFLYHENVVPQKPLFPDFFSRDKIACVVKGRMMSLPDPSKKDSKGAGALQNAVAFLRRNAPGNGASALPAPSAKVAQTALAHGRRRDSIQGATHATERNALREKGLRIVQEADQDIRAAVAEAHDCPNRENVRHKIDHVRDIEERVLRSLADISVTIVLPGQRLPCGDDDGGGGSSSSSSSSNSSNSSSRLGAFDNSTKNPDAVFQVK